MSFALVFCDIRSAQYSTSYCFGLMAPRTLFGLVFGPLSLQLNPKTLIIIISTSLRKSDWYILAKGWERLSEFIRIRILPASQESCPPTQSWSVPQSLSRQPGHVQFEYFGFAQMQWQAGKEKEKETFSSIRKAHSRLNSGYEGRENKNHIQLCWKKGGGCRGNLDILAPVNNRLVAELSFHV